MTEINTLMHQSTIKKNEVEEIKNEILTGNQLAELPLGLKLQSGSDLKGSGAPTNFDYSFS